MTARRLFIVGREHRELHDRAIRAFSGNLNVLVIYDRRASERRATAPGLVVVDRRRSERRWRPQIDAELRAFGSAVVRLD